MKADTERLATIYHALGSEVRLRILDLISRHREMCVCELVEALGVSQTNVSHHVGKLKAAGLLTSRKTGTWVIYGLRIDELSRHAGELAERLSRNLAKCTAKAVEVRIAGRCA